MLSGVDSGWLKIFEQRVWVFWALAVFCGILLYLVSLGALPTLAGLVWLSDTLTILTLLFAVLAVFSSISHIWTWASSEIHAAKAKKATIARLDSLTPIEARILGALAHTNRRSFNTRLDNGDVHTLVQKRLLVQGGGHINILEVPYTVPDAIWPELLRRKNELPPPVPGENDPWVRHWMTY
ncbi:MAG: super-infection exclusion protein B [Porphyrobacter sp.]|jgi:hypothetical protein|nr:super-infection exclusion protein B [Porphyrobacter sp.]